MRKMRIEFPDGVVEGDAEEIGGYLIFYYRGLAFEVHDYGLKFAGSYEVED